MFRRPKYLVLGLAVIATLAILLLPEKPKARAKLGIGSLFLPLFGLAAYSQQATTTAGGAIQSRASLQKQNETLRHENEALRLRLMQAEEAAAENSRLRGLLNWQAPRKNWHLKPAKVVLREPANWWRTVQIDVGTRNGVSNDLPVLTPEGLVGRVASAGLTRSQVVLLGDPFCKVYARVESESRDTGVIGPAGPLDTGLVAMNFLPPNATIKSGQNVLTSGKGGIYPEGIPIGKIVDSHPAEYGLATEARVKLNANLYSLEEVFVCLGHD